VPTGTLSVRAQRPRLVANIALAVTRALSDISLCLEFKKKGARITAAPGRTARPRDSEDVALLPSGLSTLVPNK